VASYRQSGQRQRELRQQRCIGLSTLQNYLRQERTNGQQKQRRLLEVEVVAKRVAAASESQRLELIAPNGYVLVELVRMGLTVCLYFFH
jgi:hypothetical protein